MQATEADPYAEFRGDDHNLKRVLSGLAEELKDAQGEVERLRLDLEAAEHRANELACKTIPNAADGLDGEFNLEDGTKMIISEVIRASIAEERKDPAIQWLDDNGYGALVKRQVIIQFDRKDHQKYQEFMAYLKAYDKPLVVSSNDSVHYQTLNAWVREKLAAGVDLPVQVFGIFRQRMAKLKG